jgi:uncharacterized membrane protein YhhN
VTGALAVLGAALVVPLLWAEYRGARARGLVKGLTSTAFIAVALAAGALETAYGVWLLAGLSLSWIGDVALVSSARRWFLTGLAAFLLAHVAYMAGFAVAGAQWTWAAAVAAVLVLPALAVGRWLRPNLPPEMRAPVAAYIVVISAMVAAAAGGAAGEAPFIALPAAGAFYLSDISVARDRFVAPGFSNRLWGLPLYYGAQIALALSVGMV